MRRYVGHIKRVKFRAKVGHIQRVGRQVRPLRRVTYSITRKGIVQKWQSD